MSLTAARAAAVSLCCGAMMAAIVAAPAGAATPARVATPAAAARPSQAAAPGRAVRVGTAPARPRGTKLLGSLVPSTRLDVTVALAPRDPAGLAAYAGAVSDPGSSQYHDYLSVAQFAERFGPTTSAVDAVRASLQEHGITPGALSANHLALSVDTVAGTASHAFSTSFQRLSLPDGHTAFANTAAPQVAASVAGDIQAIVGLDTIATPRPQGLSRRARDATKHAVASASPSASGSAACSTASSEAFDGAHTIDQIGSDYSFGGLYGAGDEGAGQTIGLYELERNYPNDISAFQSCFGTEANVSYRSVEGGGAAGHQQGIETELDAENVIGLAPRANVLIYQGPDTEDGSLDTYEAMIDQDTANVISTSWGDCESDLGASDAQSENTLFEEAAAQGQTVVAASGDDGSQDCDDVNGSAAAAVDDPASQPFVTGVGGTSLTTGSPLTESVWNNGPHGTGAGGGGDSSLWAMPDYQSSAAGSLNVVNSQSSAATCGASTGAWCREVPDVSADADPDTGYVIYWGGNGNATDSKAWTVVGGTSGAAPLWAALFALADGTSACSAGGVGFANSALYRVAGSDYAAYFNDVTSGNNDWLDTDNGLFAAGTGYDQASGMGTPIASSLAPALCGHSLTLADPGARSSTAGTAVALTLHATDTTSGATVTYGAQNLPPGLSLHDATGAITGTPTTVGDFEVTVQAHDDHGSSASQTFSWTVAAARYGGSPTPAGSSSPTGSGLGSGSTATTALATVTIAVPAAQHTQVRRWVSLALRASTTSGAAPSYLATGLPPGLVLDSASGQISGRASKVGSYVVTMQASSPGASPAAGRFTWTVSGPPKLSHVLLRGLGSRRQALAFELAAGPRAAPLTELAVGLPRGLSLRSAAVALKRSVSVRGGRAKVGFAAAVVHGRLIIVLRSGLPEARVSVWAPTLTASRRLARAARLGHGRRVTLTVVATDADALVTKLVAKSKPRRTRQPAAT